MMKPSVIVGKSHSSFSDQAAKDHDSVVSKSEGPKGTGCEEAVGNLISVENTHMNIRQQQPLDMLDPGSATNKSFTASVDDIADAIATTENITAGNEDRGNRGHDCAPSPLKKISAKLSPKASPSRRKMTNLKTESQAKPHDDTLATAITSLLAHHQYEACNPATLQTDSTKLRRGKRRLLGRAPSNVSITSARSLTMSRASSVDTMNTDGIGTPLESLHPHIGIAASLLANYDEMEAEQEHTNKPPPMTQLSYEDPAATAWKARLAMKMDGGDETAGPKVTTPRVKRAETIRDITGPGVQSISRRTRQAGAR